MMLSRSIRAASRPATQLRSFASVSFPGGEASGPHLATAFPGPNTKAYLEKLGTMTCNLTQHFPVDLQKSKGNYICDTDGNTFLDVFNSIACITLGYNHPAITELTKSDLMQTIVANRTGMGINPPKEYLEMLQGAFMDVAPKGLNRIGPMMCGSCAVEGAYKTSFFTYMKRQRGQRVDFDELEMESCMRNMAPGSPALGILSFNAGFHGRMLGSLSTSRTKPIHKLDMPAFDWPAANPPLYKYPLSENEEYNLEQDATSLAHVESLIKEWKTQKGIDITAVIIEPIMSEGGDRYISSNFANGLRKLTSDLGISMIVDEVQTGCAVTGTFWAHEQWNLESPPDFVTFAKKMQSCGFYMKDEHRVEQSFRHFNTFLGDPIRALITAEQNKVIKRDDLCSHAAHAGDYTRRKLEELAVKNPDLVANVRGLGTYLAFDVPRGVKERDSLVPLLREHGVNAGVCGVDTMRLRPSLYFGEKHADIFADALAKSIARL